MELFQRAVVLEQCLSNGFISGTEMSAISFQLVHFGISCGILPHMVDPPIGSIEGPLGGTHQLGHGPGIHSYTPMHHTKCAPYMEPI